MGSFFNSIPASSPSVMDATIPAMFSHVARRNACNQDELLLLHTKREGQCHRIEDEHVGFEYDWSRTSPSEIAETVIANTAKAEVTNILTRMIGREIELTNEGFKIRAAADGYQNKKILIGGKKKVIQIPHPPRGV